MSRRTKSKHLVEPEKDLVQNDTKASPNAVHDVQRLQQLLEAEKEKGRIREETISLLKDDKSYLQRELEKKDELIRDLMSNSNEDGAGTSSGTKSEKSTVKRKHGTRPLKKTSKFVDEEEDSHSLLSDSSADSSMERYKRKRSPADPRQSPQYSSSSSYRPRKATDKSADDLATRSRARNTKGIIARYKMALDAFNKGGSMKSAFELVGADRNTISRTAPIAEHRIAAPEVLRSLGAWDERKEKMSAYVERCRAAVTPEIREEIA